MAHNLTSHTDQPVEKSTAQVQCEAKGGKWDSAKKFCILPEVKDKPVDRPKGFVSLKDRQELADARAVRAGVEPRLLDVENQKFSERLVRERGLLEQERVAEEQAIGQIRLEEFQKSGFPERIELDPIVSKGGDIPVIGPFLAGIQRGLQEAEDKGSRFASPGIKRIIDRILGSDTPAEIVFQGEQLRTAALTQIRDNAINDGLTQSEKFGAMIEALPAGPLKKIIPGASDAELPAGNIQTLVKTLRTYKTTATNIELQFNKETYDFALATQLLDVIEQDMASARGRLRLLIQASAEFQFNSDGVNLIEQKIFDVETTIFATRSVLFGGKSSNPTEADIFSIMQEDFDIPGL